METFNQTYVEIDVLVLDRAQRDLLPGRDGVDREGRAVCARGQVRIRFLRHGIFSDMFVSGVWTIWERFSSLPA